MVCTPWDVRHLVRRALLINKQCIFTGLLKLNSDEVFTIMWYAQMLGEYLRLERAFSSRSRCQCCHLFSHCVFLWRCRLRNRFQNYRPPIHTFSPVGCYPIRGGNRFENVWKHLELHFMFSLIHHVSWDGMAMIQFKPLKVASLIAVTWSSHSALLSVPSASLQSVLLLVRFIFQSFIQSLMELVSVEFSSNFTHFALWSPKW